jgi:hypothetical protein
MRRFSVVLLAVSAVAVTACNPGGLGSSASVERVGPVNVHVFCDDAKGPGIGARINPWRVHTHGATTVVFNINPTPGSLTVPTTLDSVPGKAWAFQAPSDTSSNNTITAQVNTAQSGPTYYRLTLVCPADTIIVDPIVIVDE